MAGQLKWVWRRWITYRCTAEDFQNNFLLANNIHNAILVVNYFTRQHSHIFLNTQVRFEPMPISSWSRSHCTTPPGQGLCSQSFVEELNCTISNFVTCQCFVRQTYSPEKVFFLVLTCNEWMVFGLLNIGPLPVVHARLHMHIYVHTMLQKSHITKSSYFLVDESETSTCIHRMFVGAFAIQGCQMVYTISNQISKFG
jgi:hypothetical protein